MFFLHQQNPRALMFLRTKHRHVCWFVVFAALAFTLPAHAATTIPLTVTLSKPVNVVTTSGTPRIAVDVGGVTRYASYASGTGTASLTFNYATQAGDVDLDGIAVSSPIQLNGGAIADLAGNPMTNLTFTPPNTSTVRVNYPSLGMDFVADADGRYTLNGTPYNDLSSFLTATGGSFTRNSIGTYYDSAGVLQTATANTPRFDHDPVTNARKGILIEESRTNLLLRSSEVESAPWNIFSTGLTILTNNTTAPDGTNNAEFLRETTLNNYHYIYQTGTKAGSSVSYALTVYAKPSGRNIYMQLDDNVGSGAIQNFDLSTGTTGSSQTYGGGFNLSSRSISNVGNGWYRCNIIVSTNTATTFRVVIGLNSNLVNPADAYTGNGTSGAYFWGAQLEQGTIPTSYIPTTTAAVTRAADNLSMPTGSWFNAPQSTAFLNADYSGGNGGVFALSNSTAPLDNRFDLRAFQNQAIITSVGANTNLAGLNFPANIPTKVSLAYSSSVASASRNGTAVISGTPRVPVGIDKLWVGNIDSGSNWLNGHISKLKYYPIALPNTQLQLMSQ